MRQVANLRQNVAALLIGIDLDLVGDLYGTFERAVATTIQKADVPEASARQPLMLYSGVYDYPISDNIFGAALIDLRPQGVDREYRDDVAKRFIVEFDRTKKWIPWGYEVTFEYNAGVPVIRIAQNKTVQQIIIDSMTSTDGWALGGDASDLLTDSTVYYQQPAALRFNLVAGGSQGTLEKTLTNALDLTSYQGVGVAFLAAYFPDAASISSVTLRIGSDSSNYYEVTATEGFVGPLVSNEYQLIAFDLAGALQVGSPDITEMNYVDLLTNYDGGSPTYGSDIVTNGSFAGNASGWTLGANWAYSANNIVHTPGSVSSAYQAIGATDPSITYLITATVGGSAGNINIGIGDHSNFSGQQFNAGAGVVSFEVTGAPVGEIVFGPSNLFNGTITDVSVVQVLSEGVAQNNVRYGDLWISLPSPHELLYYSAAAFQPSYTAGTPAPAFQTTISNDEDNLIFRDAAYNIYMHECARAVAQNQGAGRASGIIAEIDLVLEGDGNRILGLYQQFRGDNPSEEIRVVGSYYEI